MKLEKRNDAASSGAPEEPEKGKKPVVVYIMVLFIAAFLLMAWSFASHQRSNTEALGRLQSSVSAMQEVQATQEQIIELQKELSEAQDQITELEKEKAASEACASALEPEIEAMNQLYILQQYYAARDYEACRRVIELFEVNGYAGHLPQLASEGVTFPAERYQELKEAVEAQPSPTG